MAVRTVRLNERDEAALREIRETLGLPISAALKQGIELLRQQAEQRRGPTSWEIYRQLDLGPGGYAEFTSGKVKQGVREILKRKYGR
jgi:hypothetical protein